MIDPPPGTLPNSSCAGMGAHACCVRGHIWELGAETGHVGQELPRLWSWV